MCVLGRIRCWCFGRSNCNTVKTSKKIYTAFISNESKKYHDEIEHVDFADIFSEDETLLPLQLVPLGAKNFEKVNFFIL